jgi:tripartite-type tricarboxylate transporter receptor subunit TctC
LAAALACAGAHAQYPNRAIKWVVPYPPAGTTDVLARIMAQTLSEKLGQQIVIENKPGGGNNIGVDYVAKAPPDGYTWLLVNPANGINTTLYKSLPFNFVSDIAPVAGIVRTPNVMEVTPSLPVKTVREFIDYCKANPGKINMASGGKGSSSHIFGELLKIMAGIDMLHVPYRGTGPAVTDLLGGRIDAMFAPAVVVTPHIAAGTLRVIGTTGAARSALFPDFPTVAETGLAGYSSLGWFGLFAPPGTPADIVAKISADTKTVLTLPEARQRLAEQGAEPEPTTPEAFAAFVNADIAKWLDLARKTGIKLTP